MACTHMYVLCTCLQRSSGESKLVLGDMQYVSITTVPLFTPFLFSPVALLCGLARRTSQAPQEHRSADLEQQQVSTKVCLLLTPFFANNGQDQFFLKNFLRSIRLIVDGRTISFIVKCLVILRISSLTLRSQELPHLPSLTFELQARRNSEGGGRISSFPYSYQTRGNKRGRYGPHTLSRIL